MSVSYGEVGRPVGMSTPPSLMPRFAVAELILIFPDAIRGGGKLVSEGQCGPQKDDDEQESVRGQSFFQLHG